MTVKRSGMALTRKRTIVPLQLQRGARWPMSRPMTLRPILLHPDPRLKKVATPVGAVDDDIRKLAEDMLDTMYDAPGIGLAAPQVNVLQRLIVVDCEKDDGAEPSPIVMLNPEVLQSSEAVSVYEEGCLSIPDLFAEGRGLLRLMSLTD